MADLFGINSWEWGSAAKAVELYQGDEAYKHYKGAQKNPGLYTTTRPNGGAKAAFTMEDTSSGGIDDNNYDEDISFYKIEQPKAAATAAAPAPKPAPKPVVPKEKSLKIEPVKHTPEIEQAKSRVQEYEKKDYSNIFKQDETDFTAKFNPSGKSDNSGGPQKDPQAFADKYKFEVAQSNKQFDTTSANPMTSDDILKRDKQQYGDYM